MFCRITSGEVDKVLVCEPSDIAPDGMVKLAVKALYETLTEKLDMGHDLDIVLTLGITLQFRDYPNIEDELLGADRILLIGNVLAIWSQMRKRGEGGIIP